MQWNTSLQKVISILSFILYATQAQAAFDCIFLVLMCNLCDDGQNLETQY